VDGVERTCVGGTVLLNDVLFGPIILIMDRGAKKVLKLLMFFYSACLYNSFLTTIASWNNLLTVIYSL
jgi:hypothetical protein